MTSERSTISGLEINLQPTSNSHRITYRRILRRTLSSASSRRQTLMLMTHSPTPSSQGPVIPTTLLSTSMAATCVQTAASISKRNPATPFASSPPTKMDCSPRSNSPSPLRMSTKLRRTLRSPRTPSPRTRELTRSSVLFRPPMSTAMTHSPTPSSQGPVIPTTLLSTSMATTCVQRAALISKPNQATPYASGRPIKVD